MKLYKVRIFTVILNFKKKIFLC